MHHAATVQPTASGAGVPKLGLFKNICTGPRTWAILNLYISTEERRSQLPLQIPNNVPPAVSVPQPRQSSPLSVAMRKIPRDGVWHRVGEPVGGTTAEQYARRMNAAFALLNEPTWVFGYKERGELSEVWVIWVGAR